MTAAPVTDMAGLANPIRLRLVAQIVEDARTDRSIPETLAMLDVAGLTGDRAALASALDATDDPSYVAAIAALATPAAVNDVGQPCPVCGVEIDPDRSMS